MFVWLLNRGWVEDHLFELIPFQKPNCRYLHGSSILGPIYGDLFFKPRGLLFSTKFEVSGAAEFYRYMEMEIEVCSIIQLTFEASTAWESERGRLCVLVRERKGESEGACVFACVREREK